MSILTILMAIGMNATPIEETTVKQDTLYLGHDSIVIVETACAPICSSIVRVYNMVWEELGLITPPFEHAVFPEAYIENGKLLWRDNTDAMLDEEEKRGRVQNQ